MPFPPINKDGERFDFCGLNSLQWIIKTQTYEYFIDPRLQNRLQNQAGWLNGTAYPTWSGNSVLTGHVANADGKPGVFAKLKALGVGEFIYIYNGGYRYTYQVVSNEYVQPNDASVVKHEEKSFLTLVTCDTYDEKTGTYLRRVSVRAKLVDVRLVQ